MIWKYIKPYGGKIALVIALVIIQATLELSLTEYMSKIVNTGIASSGVEYAAPELMRESSMNELFGEESEIYDFYKLTPGDEVEGLEGFGDGSDEHIYVLIDKGKNAVLAAEKTFVTAFEGGNKALALNYILDEYAAIGIDVGESQSGYILKTGGAMLLIAVLGTGAAILASLNSTRVAAGFARDLRKGVFSKVMSFSSTEFDKFSSASLITRCTNDVQQLQMFLGMGMRIVVFAPAMGIGAIIRVINSQSSLTWILALAIGAIVAVVIVLFGVTNEKFKINQKLTDRANKTIREALSGILVIRAFSNQQSTEERFEEVNLDMRNTNRFITRTMGAMNPVMSLIMNLAVIAIIYFGAKYVAAGFIQVGSIMAFIEYSNHVVRSFLMISMISIFIPRAMVSINRVKEVLECETSINNAADTVKADKTKAGLVEFDNVCFKYNDADENILTNVTFTANPGETTAIIGTTGCGKSTVVNLIPRLYDVTEGQVRISGVNVKDMAIEDLRSKISYAPQKGILFSGDIESNIKFAGEEIDDETMEKAAKIAQAYDFVMDKEGKFASSVAQGGSNLSGGQRQRVSIARALAKPSEIIIFDDSFSALDYKTDANLRRALKAELGEKTIILVAQRISTIRDAAKIIVMDEGIIVGQGSHDELMKTCEVYRQIASSQIGEGGDVA
ncbi:ABC transporter ATP-binding protein/permease [Tyzzerella sp. OttesenSCG-928-J15]|nr:ABC transporter ATP-binding protein/permease [Tyzzerella sp. OttesenSCG-928-J15]